MYLVFWYSTWIWAYVYFGYDVELPIYWLLEVDTVCLVDPVALPG